MSRKMKRKTKTKIVDDVDNVEQENEGVKVDNKVEIDNKIDLKEIEKIEVETAEKRYVLKKNYTPKKKKIKLEGEKLKTASFGVAQEIFRFISSMSANDSDPPNMCFGVIMVLFVFSIYIFFHFYSFLFHLSL